MLIPNIYTFITILILYVIKGVPVDTYIVHLDFTMNNHVQNAFSLKLWTVTFFFLFLDIIFYTYYYYYKL